MGELDGVGMREEFGEEGVCGQGDEYGRGIGVSSTRGGVVEAVDKLKVQAFF